MRPKRSGDHLAAMRGGARYRGDRGGKAIMKSSNIGGQAVLEGIMMKHKDEYAVAVRKPDGEIIVEKDTYRSIVGNAKKLTQILLSGHL